MNIVNQTAQVTLEELRVSLAELVGKVMYGKERVMVTKYNRDAFVILNVEDYQAILDPVKRLSKQAWLAATTELDTIRQNLPELDSEIVEQTVIGEIQTLRKEKAKASVR